MMHDNDTYDIHANVFWFKLFKYDLKKDIVNFWNFQQSGYLYT